MIIDRTRVEKLLDLVRKAYPDWSGVADPRFAQDEIDYKRVAVAKAAELLGWETLRQLLVSGDVEGFIARLEKVGKSTNLLYTQAPRRGDLGILYHPSLDKRSYCDAMLDLLYGQGSSAERLERYITYVIQHRLPNKWATPTYFLFLCHPESEMVIKPEATRWLLEFFGMGRVWRGAPHPSVYGAALRLAHTLREELGPCGVRDMIDLQSIVWVASRHADRARYWKISPGEDAWQWEECRKGSFIGVGWELFGDISSMSRAAFDARYNEILRSFPDLRSDPAWSRTSVKQLWDFARIKQGDVIVANRGTREVLGTGRVAGGYYFLPGQRNGHRLPVVWRDTPRTVEEEGWRRLLLQLDEEAFMQLHAEPPATEEVIEQVDIAPSHLPHDLPAEPILGEEQAPYRVAPALEEEEAPEEPIVEQPPYTIEECARDTGIDEETLRRWTRAVERKGQAIIYGPPGTGKTFAAEHLARHLVGGGDGIVRLVQLHPAYSYEDFVLGIRPRTRRDGTLEYPLVPGRFLQFCTEARRRSGLCVLVLDEINRANLSRVFGELMYLLEYRDAEVPLAGGIPFSIPRNVRIIGTMNTADRSIALVDHALRRRFAFIPLGPSYELLARYHAGGSFPVDALVELLRRVNREINDPHYELGISYFLRANIDEQIEDIWRMEIEPYLEEYFFDQPGKVAQFRWEMVKERFAR